jgi:hypothetical protein
MSDQLRAALRELGDVPPPTDLASGALARARRDRRRRQAGLAAAVVLAVTAAIAVPVALLRRAELPPAAPVPAVWVSWYQVGAASDQDFFFYDPASRGYRPAPTRLADGVIAAMSPDGARAVVAQSPEGPTGPTGRTGRTAIVGLDRVAAGLTEAAWSARIPDGFWEWSPDGTRLLDQPRTDRPHEARVVDVRSRRLTRVPLQLFAADYGDRLGWGPRGRGFVIWWDQVHGRPMAGPGPALAVLDEAGRLTRRYPLPAKVDLVQLSPDGGRALLVSVGSEARQASILDLGTGSVTPIAGHPTWWYNERTLLRVDVPASGPSALVLVDADTGREVRRSGPPVAGPGQLTSILLARGTPPPGAIVP